MPMLSAILLSSLEGWHSCIRRRHLLNTWNRHHEIKPTHARIVCISIHVDKPNGKTRKALLAAEKTAGHIAVATARGCRILYAGVRLRIRLQCFRFVVDNANPNVQVFA